YRPRLPQLVLRLPRAETLLYEGQDPQEVSLEGTLELPAERSEFAAELLVNGAVSNSRPILDPSRQHVTARIPLQLRDNRIQLRLSNAWKVTSLSEPILVRYLRPPHRLHFTTVQSGMRSLADYVGWPRWASLPGISQVTEKPVADLAARLYSARPLTFV